MIMLDQATQTQMIGRLVGDLGNHIAVTVIPDSEPRAGSALTGYVLAVRTDGREYVTWAYSAYAGPGQTGRDVNVYWGQTFHVGDDGDAHAVFEAASRDLAARATR
jgi:hypothetical protein